MHQKHHFIKGLKDGFPICLGYIPVSFAFGMYATQNGLLWWVPVLISMTNLTSAGQFAGLSLIISGGMYLEVAVTTFIINIRYMLMSLALSQKVDPLMKFYERCSIAFGVTDEIFAVAILKKEPLKTSYMFGLISMPFLGWTVGTLLGATATSILPNSVQTALGITIYSMFIAIFIPPSKKAKPVLITCIIAVCISCFFKWTPPLKQVSNGWVIIIAAVIAAGYAALRYPIDDKKDESPEKADESEAEMDKEREMETV